MNKRVLHHIWKTMRPLSHWLFLVLCLVSLVTGLLALRQNNLKALALRDKVLAVDEKNGDVEAALRELRTFVYGHMNTNLAGGQNAIKPPIQLKYRYERLLAAEKERVSSKNSTIYNDAQNDCERRFPTGLYGSGRIPCIQQYIAEHGGAVEQAIPDSLYKFDFISPRWSPDFAGIMLAFSGLFFVLFVFRYSLERWLKHKFHEHA